MKYAILYTLTLGCNAITGIDDYRIGEFNDAGTDQFHDQMSETGRNQPDSLIGNDSGKPVVDSSIAEDSIETASTDSISPIPDSDTAESSCDTMNSCGGCGDNCTIYCLASDYSCKGEFTYCHLWPPGKLCTMYASDGGKVTGCIVCTGPNSMKCKESC